MIAVVPAYFHERVVRVNTPPLRKERMRISVLRNTALHDAIVHTHHRTIYPEDEAPIISFMEKLAGRKVTAAEKKLAFALTADHCEALGETLKERRWAKYPAAPLLPIDSDPGEMDPEAIARFNMKEPKVKKQKSKQKSVSV